MTGFEIFGLLLAGIMTLFAVVLTMLGAEAAKRRQISDALLHLRWSGIMTFSSFILMTSLIYKCEVICWVARHETGTQNNEALAEQIADASRIVVPETEFKFASATGGITNIIKYSDGKFGPVSFIGGREDAERIGAECSGSTIASGGGAACPANGSALTMSFR